ncbi:MAG: indole-3-glycerol phosphate synthase TrpC [Lachnospiraceae bacterium]|nr:indole-3-glycerol phosphate synthase TrpC [Lachnospiraceae bacterium]
MAENILMEIAEKTAIRIEDKKNHLSLEELKKMTYESLESKEFGHPSFIEALKKPGMSYICEVKKASPSKGVIAEDFPYLQIAQDYEAAGASAISCLTEPSYFLGSYQYLKEIVEVVHIPVLRKDFTIDEYMIYEAAYLGASAILLIVSLLSDDQLKAFIKLTEELGMDALVEAHNEIEIRRGIEQGAKIIGVNNRDLKTFTVDSMNSVNLRKIADPEVVFVSESGIKTAADIALLRENHIDAVLIGETLMRAEDKKSMLEELNGGAINP